MTEFIDIQILLPQLNKNKMRLKVIEDEQFFLYPLYRSYHASIIFVSYFILRIKFEL